MQLNKFYWCKKKTLRKLLKTKEMRTCTLITHTLTSVEVNFADTKCSGS